MQTLSPGASENLTQLRNVIDARRSAEKCIILRSRHVITRLMDTENDTSATGELVVRPKNTVYYSLAIAIVCYRFPVALLVRLRLTFDPIC